MTMKTAQQVGRVVAALLDTGARTATMYVDSNMTIRATRKGKGDRRERRTDIALTIGKPNFLARKAIKDLRSAGVEFPVRKIELKWPPKRRKAKR
jgi:hypothetical protein